MDPRNNNWNISDFGPKLAISLLDGALLVAYHAQTIGYNCVRAILPVSSFNLNSNQTTIASYFETKIVSCNPWYKCFPGIGFCTRQFSLKNDFVRNYDGFGSFGVCRKSGIHIDGHFNKFQDDPTDHEYFEPGDVIGVGIIHVPANSSIKCFATLNGRLMGTFNLPAKFANLQLFPAASLFNAGESIRANFGREAWRFDPSQLLN